MQVEYANCLFMPGEGIGPGRNGSECERNEVLPIGDASGDKASGPSLTSSSITIPSGRRMQKSRQEQG